MEVNSFWNGEELTKLEQLCLSSFVRNNITYNLYVYDEPLGVPAGVLLHDATEILPRARLFHYEAGNFNLGSVAGFSNLIRYLLIYRKGGWWIDTDICFVKPFDRDSSEIFFRAPTKTGDFLVASGIFKAPAGSPVLQNCLDVFATKDVQKIIHGETGPQLLTEAILRTGRRDAVLASDQIFPVPWWEYNRLFSDEQFCLEDCCTVHFFNSLITDAGLNKNASFAPASVFERLKQRYL